MSFCSELSAKLDAIILLLEQTPVCCNGEYTYLSAPDYPLDGTGNVPQPVIDAGYASGTSDWAGFQEYKCMAAHAMIDGLRVALAEMQPLVEAGGFIFEAGLEILQSLGIIALGTATFGPIVVSGAVIVGLLLALKDPLLESLDVISQDLEDNRYELACAMAGGDGVADIAQRFKDKVDELFTDTEALVIKNLNIDYLVETYFLGAYGDSAAAAAMAEAGYDPDDYACCDVAFPVILAAGTILENSPLIVESQFVDDPSYDYYYCNVEFWTLPNGGGSRVAVEVTTLTTTLRDPLITDGSGYAYYLHNAAQQQTYASDTKPSLPFTAHRITLVDEKRPTGSVHFVATMDWNTV